MTIGRRPSFFNGTTWGTKGEQPFLPGSICVAALDPGYLFLLRWGEIGNSKAPERLINNRKESNFFLYRNLNDAMMDNGMLPPGVHAERGCC
jgi:hypothetical protein